jgi:hypothetical protein
MSAAMLDQKAMTIPLALASMVAAGCSFEAPLPTNLLCNFDRDCQQVEPLAVCRYDLSRRGHYCCIGAICQADAAVPLDTSPDQEGPDVASDAVDRFGETTIEWSPVVSSYLTGDQPSSPRLGLTEFHKSWLCWVRNADPPGLFVRQLEDSSFLPRLTSAIPTGPPSLIVDGSSSPILAWADAGKIFVHGFDGGWETNPTPINTPDPEGRASCPALVNHQRFTVAAWAQGHPRAINLRVRQIPNWTEDYPRLFSQPDRDVGCPLLASDPVGPLTAAWAEEGSNGASVFVFHARPGQSWIQWGDSLQAVGGAVRLSGLTIDRRGFPAVTWQVWDEASGRSSIFVQGWNGTRWIPPAERPAGFDVVTPAANQTAALAVDPKGSLWLAWVGLAAETPEGEVRIRVWRLIQGTWTPAGRAITVPGSPLELRLDISADEAFVTSTSGGGGRSYLNVFKARLP